MIQDKIENIATYHVWLKRGGPAVFQALGYTESKKEKRIYFHLEINHKDKEIFFRTDEIVGVSLDDRLMKSGINVSADGFLKKLEAMKKAKTAK